MPTSAWALRFWLPVIYAALSAKLSTFEHGATVHDVVAELFQTAYRYMLVHEEARIPLLAALGTCMVLTARKKSFAPLISYVGCLSLWLLGISSLFPANRLAIVHSLPLLSSEQCDAIVAAAEDAGRTALWDTSRHWKYATEDLGLDSVPRARDLLLPELQRVVFPFISERCCGGPSACDVTLRDSFIVRYRTGGQKGLGMHRDGHHVSFNLALTANGTDFDGGGTGFRRLPSPLVTPKGHVLVHGGALAHSGVPITSGTRYLVVGFATLSISSRPEGGQGGGGAAMRMMARAAGLAFGSLWGGLASEVRVEEHGRAAEGEPI
jgi:hypothetical protein